MELIQKVPAFKGVANRTVVFQLPKAAPLSRKLNDDDGSLQELSSRYGDHYSRAGGAKRIVSAALRRVRSWGTASWPN
jgi:hypothetical protein